MQETRVGLGVDLDIPYDTAIEQTTAALAAEGFGVLTSIDVQATLKKKLDREFRRYVILGACNPHLASRALDTDLEVGLLLPCNVIVYETAPGKSRVVAMAPLTALKIASEAPELVNVATEADTRLRRALTTLTPATPGPAGTEE